MRVTTICSGLFLLRNDAHTKPAHSQNDLTRLLLSRQPSSKLCSNTPATFDVSIPAVPVFAAEAPAGHRLSLCKLSVLDEAEHMRRLLPRQPSSKLCCMSQMTCSNAADTFVVSIPAVPLLGPEAPAGHELSLCKLSVLGEAEHMRRLLTPLLSIALRLLMSAVTIPRTFSVTRP